MGHPRDLMSLRAVGMTSGGACRVPRTNAQTFPLKPKAGLNGAPSGFNFAPGCRDDPRRCVSGTFAFSAPSATLPSGHENKHPVLCIRTSVLFDESHTLRASPDPVAARQAEYAESVPGGAGMDAGTKGQLPAAVNAGTGGAAGGGAGRRLCVSPAGA